MRYNWQLNGMNKATGDHVGATIVAESFSQAVRKACALNSVVDQYEVDEVSPCLADLPAEYVGPGRNPRGAWYRFQAAGTEISIVTPGSDEEDALGRVEQIFPGYELALRSVSIYRTDRDTSNNLPVYNLMGRRKGQEDFTVNFVEASDESGAMKVAQKIARADEYRCQFVLFEPDMT